MEKKAKPELPDAFLWLKDLPQKTASERFTAEQMVECDACKRKNAPTRLACLYCGASLKIGEAQADFTRPTLRKLESWEKGWNVIYLPQDGDNFTSDILGQTADFMRLEQGELQKILAVRQALPIARAESAEEAELIEKHLKEQGVNVEIVADVNLQTDVLPNRVRGMEIGGSYVNLHLISKDEVVCMFYAEIELFVMGTLFERQVENRERRRGEDRFEIKDSRELSSDESVLDFYTTGERTGYRISSQSFDFSCLGDEKKLLASENFQILLEKLKTKAHNAEFDEGYKRVRQMLNVVWHLDERSESMGIHREGIGKINIDSRLTISNAAQFLRYSRLLRELKDKE